MKLRYYLRGLGIGIIVTAILMGFSEDKKQNMTDAQIKARAAELGMIESTTLSEPSRKATPELTEEPEKVTVTPTSESTPEPTVTPEEETEQAAATLTPEPTVTPEEETEQATATPIPEATTETNTDAETEETVTIIIYKGDSSVTVSRAAAKAGLVENAADFDMYLCANGYDKKLAVGTHVIPLEATYEEIAKELVSRP